MASQTDQDKPESLNKWLDTGDNVMNGIELERARATIVEKDRGIARLAR